MYVFLNVFFPSNLYLYNTVLSVLFCVNKDAIFIVIIITWIIRQVNSMHDIVCSRWHFSDQLCTIETLFVISLCSSEIFPSLVILTVLVRMNFITVIAT